jgi:hypothetical protein
MRPESESGGNCGYYEGQVVVDRLPNTLVEFKLPLEKDWTKGVGRQGL